MGFSPWSVIALKKERSYLNGRKKDNAEKDFNHQKDSYKEYLYTVKTNNYWKRIRCVTGKKIDNPDVIHDRIWEVVKKFI